MMDDLKETRAPVDPKDRKFFIKEFRKSATAYFNLYRGKRKLTPDEINYLLSGLKINSLIPREVAEGTLTGIKTELAAQLEEIVIYPDPKYLEEMKTIIEASYERGKIPGGEPVGMLVGQSSSHPLTQMNLNAFHQAGISEANISLGFPRFDELLRGSKNQKMSNMTIFLDRDVCKVDDPAEVWKIGHHSFEYHNLGDFMVDHEIHFKRRIPKSEVKAYEFFSSVFSSEAVSEVNVDYKFTRKHMARVLAKYFENHPEKYTEFKEALEP